MTTATKHIGIWVSWTMLTKKYAQQRLLSKEPVIKAISKPGSQENELRKIMTA